MADLQLNLMGDKRVIQKIDRLKRKLRGLRPEMREAGEVLTEEYEKNFPAEGSRLGSKWQALRQGTIEQKAKLGYGAQPILVRTGAMMRNFRKQVRNYSVRVYNPTPYFKYHQRGDSPQPQRKMIVLPERLKQEVIAVFTRAISKTIR